MNTKVLSKRDNFMARVLSNLKERSMQEFGPMEQRLKFQSCAEAYRVSYCLGVLGKMEI